MKSWLFAAAMSLAAATAPAQAAPITYQPLWTGSFSGTVEAESGPFGTPEKWTYYSFGLGFLKEATVTVTPVSPDLDVVIALFYGKEADSDFYFDMFSGGLSSIPVAFSDGIGFATGIGAPAQLSVVNTFGSDFFVLAVADWTDGVGTGPLAFTVDAQIPEAQTLALMLAGVGALAFVRRRKA